MVESYVVRPGRVAKRADSVTGRPADAETRSASVHTRALIADTGRPCSGCCPSLLPALISVRAHVLWSLYALVNTAADALQRGGICESHIYILLSCPVLDEWSLAGFMTSALGLQ